MTEELKKVLEEWKNHNDEYGGGKDYTVEKNPVLKSEYNITLSRCIKLTILRMNTEYKASHECNYDLRPGRGCDGIT